MELEETRYSNFVIFEGRINGYNFRELSSYLVKEIVSGSSTMQIRPTEIWCDNKAVTAMTKNPACHNRTKHIDCCYRFIHNLVIVES